MSIEFELPNIGEGVETADIAEILVSPCDTVAVDQIIMELETEKAVVELPITIAGTIDAFGADHADYWLISGLQGRRGINTELLSKIMEQIVDSQKILCYTDANYAFKTACERALSDDLIVIFGSFRLIGGILQAL